MPREGWELVVADYSQIELRLLAHMSRDPVLVSAFRNGEDIHTRTAAEVFGTPPLMVTSEMRRNAKAVNFGIVYGQTPLGPGGAARNRSQRSGGLYPQLFRAIFRRKEIYRPDDRRGAEDRRRKDAARTGTADSGYERQESECPVLCRAHGGEHSAARNGGGPDQDGDDPDRPGTDASGTVEAKMLLQVHDELVLEAPPEEVAEVKQLVKHEMESVYPAWKFR